MNGVHRLWGSLFFIIKNYAIIRAMYFDTGFSRKGVKII